MHRARPAEGLFKLGICHTISNRFHLIYSSVENIRRYYIKQKYTCKKIIMFFLHKNIGNVILILFCFFMHHLRFGWRGRLMFGYI